MSGPFLSSDSGEAAAVEMAAIMSKQQGIPIFVVESQNREGYWEFHVVADRKQAPGQDKRTVCRVDVLMWDDE